MGLIYRSISNNARSTNNPSLQAMPKKKPPEGGFFLGIGGQGGVDQGPGIRT